MQTQSMPKVIVSYLQKLELELKKIPGISPEEALCDAREFLLNDYAAAQRSGEPLEDSSYSNHIVETFGTPEQVAAQYAPAAMGEPAPNLPAEGYAPGWRICCTTCGRSAPLAMIGGVRVMARSVHKYTLGYCRACGGLRFMRIIQDLDDANLTSHLSIDNTPEELRAAMHQPMKTIGTILGLVAIMIVAIWIVVAGIIFMVWKLKGN